MRIAMWSGPRNLSTAMMYSFGARDDCAVWDEPYYAAYLAETGLVHPLHEEILGAGETNPDVVAQMCTGPVPDGKSVFYQKHMTHHMRPDFSRDWIKDQVNVFLIRHPARVIASYTAKRENPTAEDIGFAAQTELFERVCDHLGTPPPVIDSFEVRANPERILRRLCEVIGLAFQPSMLSWPKGGHKNDGVWAPHWYGAVWRSTGFAGAEGPLPEVAENARTLLEASMPHYQAMAAHKI